MQISKMKVGTMYLVNIRQNWRERVYDNEAYILMSTEPYREITKTWSFRHVTDTVTVDGVEYSYHGQPWEPAYGASSKLYIMQRVDPETRKPILNERDGKPFLSLIGTRVVRGEWAEVKAQQDKTMEAERKRREKERQEIHHRWNRAEGVAIRLRSLLGLESNSSAVVPAGPSYGISGGPTSIKIHVTYAEAIADQLTEAHQEIEDLKAEIRELRG